MKGKFGRGLERILAGGIIFIGSLVGIVNAGNIKVIAWNSGTPSSGPVAKLKTTGNNVPYLESPSGTIGIYFVSGESKLKEKVIGINSTEPQDMYAEIFSGTPGDEYWAFDILDNTDFEWKNIIGHRYGQSGVNDPDAIPEDTVDIKYLDGTGWYQSGSFSGINNGDYDRWKFELFNNCDLNRDGKVNFPDYAIFAGKWGTTGIDKGSDPNALDDYADIDENGTVEVNDLADFCFEWLWDANDPNTW